MMENCVPILFIYKIYTLVYIYILLAPVRDEYSREALSRLTFSLYYTEQFTQARIALHDHKSELVLLIYVYLYILYMYHDIIN